MKLIAEITASQFTTVAEVLAVFRRPRLIRRAALGTVAAVIVGGVGGVIAMITAQWLERRQIDDVIGAIGGHAEARAREPERESAEMRLQEWYEILRDELALRLDRALEGPGLESTAGRLRSGDTDPYTAALDVLADPAALARVLRDPRDGDSE